jgi:hypothetical protein
MAYPLYIAFRTAGGDGRLLIVVAALDPDDGARFPWATWYHEKAPNGEFSQVSGNYRQLGSETAVARTRIDLIRAGRPLPPEFVSQLPLIA